MSWAYTGNRMIKEISKGIIHAELKDIIGQEETKGQLKSALLTGRHVIIVGAPGIGKTTLAKNVAKLLPEITVNDCEFNCLPTEPICPKCRLQKGNIKKIKINGIGRFIRIQGSPDLTVEDLLGDIDPIKAMKYGPLSIEAFTPGKIFKANNGILFFDELNRCPEKLQNALLQVLEEGKATIGSYSVDFPANFIFIATMNPNDSSTERLSDVLMDRFDLVYMQYPETNDIEKEIVILKGERLVEFPDALLTPAIEFIRLLREDEQIEKGPSVRASIGLYERAQANAFLKGKGCVDYNDIRDAVVSVLAHRISLKPSAKYIKSPKEFIEEEFDDFNRKNYKNKMGGPP